MRTNSIKKVSLMASLWAMAHIACYGQSGGGLSISIDTILVICAIFLLIIIYLLVNTLRMAMKSSYGERIKERDSGKVLPVLIALILIGMPDTAKAATAANLDLPFSLLQILLFLGILLELVVIWVLIRWIQYFTGIDKFSSKVAQRSVRKDFSIAAIWSKMNKLRPLEEEASLDIGHEYDGIRELDNATPPWFTIGFLLTILFGAFYMYRYHIAFSAPNQIQEYEMAVAEARIAQAALLSGQTNLVDESNVTMVDEVGLQVGAALYAANCIACHGDKGQGTVGPNLTDDYWVNGGSLNDIFATIKYGVLDKGMQAWNETFSPVQMANLTGYVRTLHNTNPPNPKEKQGEFYDLASEKTAAPGAEDAPAAQPDSTTTN